MKWILIILVTIATLNSCKKVNGFGGHCGPGMGPKVEGKYTGTFVRWVGKPAPILAITNVQITFSGTGFNGNSDSLNYPSICSGSFAVTDMPDSIHFINQCDFPANFDWTLVLNGAYKLTQSGDSLYIRRLYGDFAYEEDVYSLHRQ
jgi:hypothetical protein